MSTPKWESQTCFVCGTESKICFFSDTEMGARDLDQRPAEMKRSTMPFWIHECPHCGFISQDLSDRTHVTQEWLKGELFTSCGGRTFSSRLAQQFYKFYLINQYDNNAAASFYAARCAAWECDDTEDNENAVYCRQCALTALDQLAAQDPPIDPDILEDLFVIRADLLRRCGQFEQVIAEYSEKQFSLEVMNKIIAFQIEKAQQQDTRRYDLSDVPGIEEE